MYPQWLGTCISPSPCVYMFLSRSLTGGDESVTALQDAGDVWVMHKQQYLLYAVRNSCCFIHINSNKWQYVVSFK